MSDKETIHLLRFALAAIWTEIDMAEAPNLEHCWEIAGQALDLTVEQAGPKDYTNQFRGLESWQVFLKSHGIDVNEQI